MFSDMLPADMPTFDDRSRSKDLLDLRGHGTQKPSPDEVIVRFFNVRAYPRLSRFLQNFFFFLAELSVLILFKLVSHAIFRIKTL